MFLTECFGQPETRGREVAKRLAAVLVDRDTRIVVVGHPLRRDLRLPDDVAAARVASQAALWREGS